MFLKQPGMINVQINTINTDRSTEELVNESNISLTFAPTPEFVDLIENKAGFTRRGRAAWSLPATATRSLTRFIQGYVDEYLPGSAISKNDLDLFNLSGDYDSGSAEIMPGSPKREGYSNLNERLRGGGRNAYFQPGLSPSNRELYYITNGSREGVFPGLRLPNYSDNPDHLNYWNYAWTFRNNEGRQALIRRFNDPSVTTLTDLKDERELEKRFRLHSFLSISFTRAGVMWVRLAPHPGVRVFQHIHVPSMRTSRERFVTPAEAGRTVAMLRHYWGDTIFSEDSADALELISKSQDAILLGYVPNKPAQTALEIGREVPATMITKIQRALARRNITVDRDQSQSPLIKEDEEELIPFFMRKRLRRELQSSYTYMLDLTQALDIEKKFSKKVNFYTHPSLKDMVNMQNSTPFAGEPRLRPFQKEAVGLHLSTNIGYLQSSSPGMGKTIMQLVAMRERAKLVDNYRGLVVSEANVRQQWAEEAKIWFPDAHVVIVGGAKDYPAVLKGLSLKGPVVIIMSYAQTLEVYDTMIEQAEVEKERSRVLRNRGLSLTQKMRIISNLGTDISPTIGNILLSTQWDDISADEAVVLRNNSSKQARAMWKLRNNAQVATALTATPINKSPDDIGRLLSWVRNDSLMFNGSPLAEIYDTTTPQGAKELFNSLGKLIFRRDTSEVSDELPTVEQKVHFLTPNPAEKALVVAAEEELKRCYEELLTALEERENAETDVDQEEIRQIREELQEARGAWLGGTQLATMATSDPHSILESESVGAALLIGQGLVHAAIDSQPTKRAKFIKEVQQRVLNGEQVIAFTQFSSVANILVKALEENGIKAKSFTGKGGKQRDRNRVDFQNGVIDVLVCTQAAERGLTLHRAAALYHYDLPWTIERITQRTGRSIRIGSENTKVEVVFMVMKDTIEHRMAERLVSLGATSSLILDNSRGIDIKKTELAGAMSGLMTTVAKNSETQSIRAFGKLLGFEK